MKSKKEKVFLGKKHSEFIDKKKEKSLSKKEKQIKGQWSPEEDNLLKEHVENYGPKNWWFCSMNIPGRSSRQCRDHWNYILSPNLKKGNWTSRDIFLIMLFYKKFNGSWNKISPIFKSRTDNSIKNIFYSKLRKYVYSKKKKSINNKNNNKKDGLDSLLKYYDVAFKQ